MSSLKLKPQRSTRSFVGVVTLWVTVALGLAAHGSLRDPTDLTTLSCRMEFWGPWGWGTYVGAFMAQYVVSSVIQGLLGRQPDMMGSWGTYCSLNLIYLPGVVAGGNQCHQPQPPWGHDGDVVGMCGSCAEPQLHSLLRAVVSWCQHQLLGGGCPCHSDRDPARGWGSCCHSPLQADGGLHPGPGHGLPAVLDLGPGAREMLGCLVALASPELLPPLTPLTSRL